MLTDTPCLSGTLLTIYHDFLWEFPLGISSDDDDDDDDDDFLRGLFGVIFGAL